MTLSRDLTAPEAIKAACKHVSLAPTPAQHPELVRGMGDHYQQCLEAGKSVAFYGIPLQELNEEERMVALGEHIIGAIAKEEWFHAERKLLEEKL